MDFFETKAAKFQNNIKDFRKSECGVVTTEHMLIYPFLFLIFFWMVTSGLVMMKWVMLEHGVDSVVRELRIFGLPDNVTTNEQAHGYLKAKICTKVEVLSECETSLLLQVTTIRANKDVSPDAVPCHESPVEIAPLTDLPLVEDGSRSYANLQDVMHIKACVALNPILPLQYLLPLTSDNKGQIWLIAESVYVNEPG
jgi:hypothetical protein